MKRLVWLAAGVALPVSLCLARPALGQFAGGLGGEYGDLSSSGTVHGIVKHRNFARGLLEIASGARTVTIHATPDQLTDFRVGDDVDVDYDDYAGVRWLSDGGGSAGGALGGGLGYGYGGSYAEEGTTSGSVANVDTSRGILRLREAGGTRTFHAHPEDLQDVIPGQFVSVTYERIGGAAWVEQVDQGGVGTGLGAGIGRTFP
ncbi:MAG TPA: hypothetical protein VMB50_17290 [Myxococcales bacterium]|nr:hypothetical protein [Myxococcales bacterium]